MSTHDATSRPPSSRPPLSRPRWSVPVRAIVHGAILAREPNRGAMPVVTVAAADERPDAHL